MPRAWGIALQQDLCGALCGVRTAAAKRRAEADMAGAGCIATTASCECSNSALWDDAGFSIAEC